MRPLVARGVLQGYPDGRFHPERTLSRAEYVKMLVTAVSRPLSSALMMAAARPVFGDVGREHWARRYVESAWERGWTAGAEGDRFRPEAPITRAEATVMLARAAHLDPRAGAGRSPDFRDADAIPPWARPAVAAAVGAGLVRGYPDGTFRPGGTTTRAEAAALMHRHLADRGLLYDLVGTIVEEPATFRGPGRGSAARLVIDTGGTSRVTLHVPADTDARRNGRTASVFDARALDEVGVILAAGRPVYLDAWFADARGVLISASRSRRRVTYRNPTGQLRRAALETTARVFRDGRSATLDELAAGDLLYLVFSRTGTLRGVDAVSADLRGTIWSVDYTGRRLLVGRATTSARWVQVSPDALVFVDGGRVEAAAVRIGDVVIASLDEAGRVTYLEAYRRGRPPR